MEEKKVLGKCPKCGQDIDVGKYGAYCSGKCGMYVKRVFGVELTDKQITGLLNGEKVLVKDIVSKKTGNTYDAYLKATGTEEYQYTAGDGTEKHGTRWIIEKEFPEKPKENEEPVPSLEQQVDEKILEQAAGAEDSFIFS